MAAWIVAGAVFVVVFVGVCGLVVLIAGAMLEREP
jgi:hypothetical protein